MGLERWLVGLGAAALLIEVPVQRVQVREGAGFDDVGRYTFAGNNAAGIAVELDADAHFADGVLAARHTRHAVVLQVAFDAGDAVYRLEHRVNRAVARARVADRFVFVGADEP